MRKRQLLFIRHVKRTHLQQITFLFLIPQRNSYAEQMEQAIGDDPRFRILYRLPRPEVEAAITESNAVFLYSFQEQQPLSILEAMSCGVPWFAPDAGALSTLEGGIVLKNASPSALEKAVESLTDETTRETLGRKGLPQWEARYAPDAVDRKWEELLFSSTHPEKSLRSRPPSFRTIYPPANPLPLFPIHDAQTPPSRISHSSGSPSGPAADVLFRNKDRRAIPWIFSLFHALESQEDFDIHWITLSKAVSAPETIRMRNQTIHILPLGSMGRNILTAHFLTVRRIRKTLNDIQPDLLPARMGRGAGLRSGGGCFPGKKAPFLPRELSPPAASALRRPSSSICRPFGNAWPSNIMILSRANPPGHATALRKYAPGPPVLSHGIRRGTLLLPS